MRIASAFLLCAALSLAGAGDESAFSKAMREFEAARPTAFDPGARATIDPAIEALEAAKDGRAAGPLAELLVATFREDERIRGVARVTQQRGAKANERMRTIDQNLRDLEILEKAGRTDVSPEILRLKEERARQEALFQEVELEVGDLVRQSNRTKSFRDKLVGACESVLRDASPETLPAAVAGLRGALDVAIQEQASILVRAFAARHKEDIAPALREILVHPKASKATILSACLALSEFRIREDLERLLDLWRGDPEWFGPHMRETLCRAAGRNLASFDEAVAWVGTLGTKK